MMLQVACKRSFNGEADLACLSLTDLPHVHPPESHVESIIEELPGTTVCRHMRHVYHIRLGVNLAVDFRRSPDFMQLLYQ